MPDSYDGSWGDFSTQVAPELGGVFNNQDYSNFFGSLGNTLGYTGSMFDEVPMEMDMMSESLGPYTQMGTGQQLSPGFLQQLQGLSFNPVQGAEDPSVDVSRNGQRVGSYRYGSSPGSAMKLAGMIIPGLVTGGFGAGLGALFGGGALASSAGNALASGGMTAARGGDSSQIGSSMLSSGLGSGIGAVNPAQYAGLDGALGKMFNAGVGGAAGAAINGGNAVTGGLSAMATTGLNSLGSNMSSSFGDLWNSFGGGSDTEFDQLEGSGGNFDQRQDPYGSNTYDETSPDYRYAGDFSQVAQPGMKTIQSASESAGPNISSFLPSGASVGNYLGSHGGDLASMLYGFYNNKKQQRALQGQQQQAQTSLESLYGQNSSYAKQLRANLAAKGAASGHRINTGGREVQLQAMLADRAAQHQAALGPQMYQNQMGQNNLQNNNMNMLLQGANKLGAFKAIGNGLQGMFGTNPVMQNSNPYQNYFGDYNSLSGGQ